mgnify:CR=1 FL=1
MNNCSNDGSCSWDDMVPNPSGDMGYCVGDVDAQWVQTYWDLSDNLCIEGAGHWITTSWDDESNSCVNGSGSWNSTGILF